MNNKKLISLLPLKTKRLVIRPTLIEDVDLISKMDKQEITQAFLGGIKNKTKEERITFLKKKANRMLTICLKDGNPIGFLGLNTDETNINAELSYIFDYDYCNKGYCTEACEKLIDIGFNKLKLNKIYANTIEGNNSSKRVLEKLNFKLEGVRRKDNREFLDYSISKSHFNISL